MANLEGFDATTVEPGGSFDPIPAGEYDAIIADSELKKTTKGNGEYLKLKLQVLNGQFQNRIVFDNLNIRNPNEKAQQIARGNLSAICRAVGVLTPKDSSELHNKPLKIKLAIEKDEEYGDKNIVKAYKPRNGNGNGSTVPAASSPSPAPQANAKPW
jgi:hypothetical protein